jgi:dihydrofolate reductase
MRQVIVSNIMSLDGYYEGPGRNVMVLNMDEAFDSYNLERIRAAETVLLGRTSFEGFSSYWPGIADAPDDPGNRALSADNRELSRIYNNLPKSVVSDTDAAKWLSTETERGSGDILIFGSRTTWNGLLAQGLVDEIHLMISPSALGNGTPIFDAPVDLALLEARRFDGSSNVLLRYGVQR